MIKIAIVLSAVAVVVAFPLAALAGGDQAGEEQGPSAQAQDSAPMGVGRGLAVFGACLGAGVAAVGGGIGVGRIGGSCIDAMARQPEAAGAMFAPMIVTAAMVEGGMLFAIVVCLLSILSA
jgi:F-type H+-transporting ATPase subunit c